MYDVIIVGGSYAGMAAALQLARAHRKVFVLDAGQRRNRFASAAHGILGNDGTPPGEIAAIAKEQLLKYPGLTWQDGKAISAEKEGAHFTVGTDTHQTLEASRLILATGVRDKLPGVPGLQERWGQSVFHCPYCHGYELENGHLGVLATGEISMHQALLIPDWGRTTLFTNGAFEPDQNQIEQLKARDVTIEPEEVAEIIGERATVKLRSGRLVELAGLFVAPEMNVSNPLTEQLGCEYAEGPLGSYIRTDETRETTVAGVFACGDVARVAGNVTFAMADGVMAGTAAHRSLIFGGMS